MRVCVCVCRAMNGCTERKVFRKYTRSKTIDEILPHCVASYYELVSFQFVQTFTGLCFICRCSNMCMCVLERALCIAFDCVDSSNNKTMDKTSKGLC